LLPTKLLTKSQLLIVIDSSLYRATIAIPITDHRGGALATRVVLVTIILVTRSITELISDYIRKGRYNNY
jgi:hypothetical protein